MISKPRLFRPNRLLFHTCTRRALSNPANVKTCDPLRILFCGSDNFSITSLRALNDDRITKSEAGIESIDVVCRPGKRTGRGLKTISHPPIRSMAQELQLKSYEVDTFKGWEPPVGINLVVAVSFGLLVPGRILNGAKYGGLNVHPSMLPDFRGAAPLQHTLLQGRRCTGVSVQTMHPTKFDHGRILAQTPFPGIRFPQTSTTSQLENLLAPLGARLLQDTIRERRFIGLEHDIKLDAGAIDYLTEGRGIARAPKITPEDRRIDWERMTASEILSRDRVLGRLWDDTTYAAFMGVEQKKRISYETFTRTSAYESTVRNQIGPGQYIAVPIQKLEDCREAVVVGKPAEISKEDATVNAVGEVKTAIYSTDFTVEGKGKGAGGLSFAEILRQRGIGK